MLMRLKVILTKGRKDYDVGFSEGRVTLRWIESPSHLSVTLPVLPEGVPKEFQVYFNETTLC
jgi:hypothetical protein